MTRKLFVILFFFIELAAAPVILGAQDKVDWISWEEAVEKSRKQRRKIVVDVYTDWCGWCRKMDKATFSQIPIATYLNENYYAIKFNAEYETPIQLKGVEYKFVPSGMRGYHELAVHLLQGKMSYPSVVFLDEDFNIIQAIPGFQNAETFEMIIAYFGTNSHRQLAWNKFQQSYRRENYFKGELKY
jgi:thioredoxin-related protein